MIKDFVINHIRDKLRDFLKPKELDAGLGINFQGSNCPACKYVWTHLKKPQNTVRCERRNGVGKQGHPRKPNKVALTDEAFKLFEKYLNETYIRKNWNWYQYMYITPGVWEVQKGEENITIILVNLISFTSWFLATHRDKGDRRVKKGFRQFTHIMYFYLHIMMDFVLFFGIRRKNLFLNVLNFSPTRSENRCPSVCNNITGYSNNQTTKKETEYLCDHLNIFQVVTYDTGCKY